LLKFADPLTEGADLLRGGLEVFQARGNDPERSSNRQGHCSGQTQHLDLRQEAEVEALAAELEPRLLA
jgi:hypothetical protein